MLRQLGLVDQGTRERSGAEKELQKSREALLSLARYNTYAQGRSARPGRKELLQYCEFLGGFGLPTVWETELDSPT